MRRVSIAATTFVCASAFVAFLISVPGSRAQTQTPQGCKVFYAIVQGSLPTPYQFSAKDTWGGPLYATLGGEILIGGLSGNDGTASARSSVSTFTNGVYKLCFGANFFGMKWGGPSDCYHSFTYKFPSAVVSWPTAVLPGIYRAPVAEIVPGTGNFQSASGHLNVIGPFMTWPDASSPIKVSGRWNGELSGTICGVQ